MQKLFQNFEEYKIGKANGLRGGRQLPGKLIIFKVTRQNRFNLVKHYYHFYPSDPSDKKPQSESHQLILTICVVVIASIVLIAVVIHDFKLRKKYPNFNHPEEQDIQQFSYGTRS